VLKTKKDTRSLTKANQFDSRAAGDIFAVVSARENQTNISPLN
jgi:hypothetical protein